MSCSMFWCLSQGLPYIVGALEYYFKINKSIMNQLNLQQRKLIFRELKCLFKVTLRKCEKGILEPTFSFTDYSVSPNTLFIFQYEVEKTVCGQKYIETHIKISEKWMKILRHVRLRICSILKLPSFISSFLYFLNQASQKQLSHNLLISFPSECLPNTPHQTFHMH